MNVGVLLKCSISFNSNLWDGQFEKIVFTDVRSISFARMRIVYNIVTCRSALDIMF